MRRLRLVAVLSALAAYLVLAVPGQAQTWHEVFDPFQLTTLNVELDPADWDTIRFDTTNEIEVPAMFGAADATPILVSVWRKQTPFQSVILNHPLFRSQYNSIILGLTDPDSGPLSATAISGFIDGIEPVVAEALVEDPNVGVAGIGELFARLRATVSARVTSVRAQALANMPAPRR